jgi:phospholipid transport system substrate-binding protein
MAIRRMFMFVLVGAMFGAGTIAQAEAESGGASRFIRDLGDQAIQVLQTPDLTLEQREDRFRDILRQGFNLDFIGRFVIGNHWRKASAQQQADYQQLFGEYILQTYASRFGGDAGEKLAISEEKPAGKTDVVVRTRINRPSGSPINADWRVRVTDGRYGIIDVMVQGVSMVLTHRQEFSGLIKKSGVKGLIQLLSARVDKLPATTAMAK